MSRTDQKIWTREIFLEAIDKKIQELKEQPYELSGLDLDNINLLNRERRRISKFLGLDGRKFKFRKP